MTSDPFRESTRRVYQAARDAARAEGMEGPLLVACVDAGRSSWFHNLSAKTLVLLCLAVIERTVAKMTEDSGAIIH